MEKDALVVPGVSFYCGREHLLLHLLQRGCFVLAFCRRFFLFLFVLFEMKYTAWDGDRDAGEIVFDHFFECSFKILSCFVDPLHK